MVSVVLSFDVMALQARNPSLARRMPKVVDGESPSGCHFQVLTRITQSSSPIIPYDTELTSQSRLRREEMVAATSTGVDTSNSSDAPTARDAALKTRPSSVSP